MMIMIRVVIGALGTNGRIHLKDSSWYQNPRTAEDHTPWNVPHLKKGAIHQVDINLVLTLGPRIGPVITTYHSTE